MIIIGLTGGMGSGKSFVAGKFEKKGVPVYNSDMRAKELMETHPAIKKELIDKFGSMVFKNNLLNRKLIAGRIFNDKLLLTWINELVHPVVKNDFEQWVSEKKTKIVLKEAAILIESGAYKQCNKIIVITAPKPLRIKRVMLRDNMSYKEVEERMAKQISDTERLKYAYYTIINDGIKVVDKQVDAIFNELTKQ